MNGGGTKCSSGRKESREKNEIVAVECSRSSASVLQNMRIASFERLLYTIIVIISLVHESLWN